MAGPADAAADGADDGPERPFVHLPRRRPVHRLVPVVRHLQGYDRSAFQVDLVAGVTVAALAIPSSMGLAEVAGVAPVAGLYALLLPVIAYAALGSSRQLVIGPSAAAAALVGAGVTSIAAGDPTRHAALAGMLALLTGGCFLLSRLVRLGWVADYLSRPALVGFIHGVVVILVCGQLGKMTGVPVDADGPIGELADVVVGLDDLSVTTLAVAVLALLALFAFRRWLPRSPGALIVVVAGIVAGAALDLADHGVATLGAVPSGLPELTWPRVGLTDLLELIPLAIGLLFLVYADSILTARAVAGRHRQHVDADQELLALGVANLTAGISGAFPVGNSNSRTAVNEELGVRTQIGSVASVATVGVVLLFLTAPLADLPDAVLGAVIVYGAWTLVSPADWRSLRAVSRAETLIAVVGLAAVVLFGVLAGILVAAALSMVDMVRRAARPHDAVLGYVPRLDRWGDVSVHRTAQRTPGVLVYRLGAPLFFANADYVKGRVAEAIQGTPDPVHTVVLNADGMNDLDTAGAVALTELIDDLADAGITFRMARATAPLRERLARAGLIERIGREHLHPTVAAAVEAAGADRPEGADPDAAP